MYVFPVHVVYVYMYYDILYVCMHIYVCLNYVYVMYICELICVYPYDSNYISSCLVKYRGRHREVRNDCMLVISLGLKKE